MLSLNKVFLIGNLTRDPRLRTTPSGISVGEFSIAVNDTYTTSTGERRERTVFVDIVVWKRLAENCYRFLSKGRAALVEGRLEQDTWEDRETGQRRSRLRVVAQNVTFLYRPGEDYQKPREIEGYEDRYRDRDRDRDRDRGRDRDRDRDGGRRDYQDSSQPKSNESDADEYPYENTETAATEKLDEYGLDDDDDETTTKSDDLPGDDNVPF